MQHATLKTHRQSPWAAPDLSKATCPTEQITPHDTHTPPNLSSPVRYLLIINRPFYSFSPSDILLSSKLFFQHHSEQGPLLCLEQRGHLSATEYYVQHCTSFCTYILQVYSTTTTVLLSFSQRNHRRNQIQQHIILRHSFSFIITRFVTRGRRELGSCTLVLRSGRRRGG